VKELVEVARRESKSVLRERGFEGLKNLDFSDINTEIKTMCPLTFGFLSAMMDVDCDKKTAPLALIYGIIMFKRCHELSRIQRLNTLLLIEGDSNQQVS
jgi:hypothetical protein